ncbi:MAG: winged helix-turn-helix transcriptional regulator [Thaumarchaeota archaeon]|nr:winged helix-turn-helix transcriptional regulator [Nitrososphaerota archaeon]
MKLILRGRTIEDESVADAIFKILGDKYSRRILASLAESPKSVYGISKECDISLALAYKKIKNLRKYDLVQASTSVIEEGRRYSIYRSKAHPLMVLLNNKFPSQTIVFDSDNLVNCSGCDSLNCGVYYDERYNGVRSVCYSCGANWPES